MVVHLFPKSVFVDEFIYFINKHFDRDAQKIILYTNASFDVPKTALEYDNVYDYCDYDVGWLRKQLKSADRVIIHNLSVLVRELTLLYLSPDICRKTVWMVWGSDLYCYRDKHDSLSEKIVERMRRRVIRRFPMIATLTDGDYELAVKWYGCRSKNIRLDYCEEKTKELMDEIRSSFVKQDKTVRILLGNSATVTNKHMQALDMLSRFKDEDILIYIPLSYGDTGYGKKVVEYAESIFGDKSVPLTEFMSREEYYKMLSTIDIGVFNHDRQQALGNIAALFYYGKKVYIRDDISTWEGWAGKENYKFYRTQDIETISFSEFISDDPNVVRSNCARVSDLLDTNKRAAEWKEAFEMEF